MAKLVLLVDDSTVVRSLIKVRLMGYSFDFLEARDGLEALDLLKERFVDLVICDVQMPRMNGLEFVRTLRSDPRPSVQRVPVLLLSSDDTPQIEKTGIAAGANAFIKKPVSSSSLCRAVDRWLPTRQW